MGTPLTATPSSARMRMYRAPSISRVYTRSPRSGETLMVTSGVVISSCLVSTRFRGLRSASAPKASSYRASKASTCSSDTPECSSTRPDGALVDHQWFFHLVGLVLFDHLPQLAVNRLDHLVAALVAEGILQQRLEGLHLLSGGHGSGGVEHGLHEVGVCLDVSLQ